MFKQFLTLVRGVSHEAAQAGLDSQAMTLLRQHIREATTDIEDARHAIAVATAQSERERKNTTALQERKKDLETRALQALATGKDPLAVEAADSIAVLEDEIATSQETQRIYDSEIEALKESLREAEARLRELNRGYRIAEAAEQTRKLNGSRSGGKPDSLAAAEETLNRIRQKQVEAAATTKALRKMATESDANAIRKKLAEAGCGEPMRTRAEDVLERLRKKAGHPA